MMKGHETTKSFTEIKLLDEALPPTTFDPAWSRPDAKPNPQVTYLRDV